MLNFRRPSSRRAESALLSIAAALFSAAAFAELDASSPPAAEREIASGEWTNKGYDIHGTWRIVAHADGMRYIVFDEDFKTRRGPDLKVFLSPRALADINDRTAAPGSHEIGALQSPRGAQQYEIPADLDLADYRSLLIHCKSFSHLWGGAEIAAD